MVTITKKLLEQGLSMNGALSAKQVEVMGEDKTVSGWHLRLMGKSVTEQQKIRFLELKNAHLKNKKKYKHLNQPMLFRI